MCLFSHDLVKLGVRRFDVGREEVEAEASGKGCQNLPTEEGKLQDENMPFFAFGHHFGKLKRPFGADLRIFREDIGYHEVFVALDDAGNDEKKAPKENFQLIEEHGLDGIDVFSASEDVEQAVESGIEAAVLHIIAVFADGERIDEKRLPGKGKANAHEHDERDQKDARDGDQRIGEKLTDLLL